MHLHVNYLYLFVKIKGKRLLNLYGRFHLKLQSAFKMENKIKNNIDDPERLEKLYRDDKKSFEKAFFAVYPEIEDYKIADFWKIRLEQETQKTGFFDLNKKDILVLVFTCITVGLLIKIPLIFGFDLNTYPFYEKNAGWIVLFGLVVYSFLTKNKKGNRQFTYVFAVFLVTSVYINLLPVNRESDTINLAYIHLPLLLWCVYGLIFIDFDFRDKTKRIDFIKYNGDLAVLIALIAIAGGILTGVTVGLFSAIDLHIEKFYMEYVVVWGMVSVAVVATFIIRHFPFVTNKFAPIIATIFSPLVLITLVVYLISIAVTGKDPYNDRDFLIIFNLMLLGVMAIIVFSVSETSVNKRQRFNEITLFFLVIISLIIDLVALSAILYRLGEFGFTPNRTAVLGSNLLIFGNLLLIMVDLYKVNFKQKEINQVENTIANYLPVYFGWTILAVFVLPLLFRFK